MFYTRQEVRPTVASIRFRLGVHGICKITQVRLLHQKFCNLADPHVDGISADVQAARRRDPVGPTLLQNTFDDRVHDCSHQDPAKYMFEVLLVCRTFVETVYGQHLLSFAYHEDTETCLQLRLVIVCEVFDELFREPSFILGFFRDGPLFWMLPPSEVIGLASMFR
jgi:hypothetical protein